MISILANDHSSLAKAKYFSKKLDLPLITSNNNSTLIFAITPERLELRENTAKNSKPLYVDFLSAKLNYRIKHGGG